MPTVKLSFESELAAAAPKIWAWITSARGIEAELRPLLKMTGLTGIERLRDRAVPLGKPLIRSWLLLFGFLPVDRSDLTLIGFDEGKGFVEESPMLGMALWRHERVLVPRGDATLLADRLAFEPRFATPLVRWFVGVLFRQRHRVLREAFGGRASSRV